MSIRWDLGSPDKRERGRQMENQLYMHSGKNGKLSGIQIGIISQNRVGKETIVYSRRN